MGGGRLQLGAEAGKEWRRKAAVQAEAGKECRARIAGMVWGVTDVSSAAEIFLLGMCLTPALSVFTLYSLNI